MKNNKYFYTLIVLIALALVGTSVVSAQDNSGQPENQSNNSAWNGMARNRGKGMMKPAIFGTVSAISGNTLTVSGKQGFGANAVTTTFTVDVTNAKIMKNNIAGTISSIIVGDTISAQGTLTGTNLVATNVRDGVLGNGLGNKVNKAQDLSAIVGNGQPVVAGTVSSISGNMISITNKSNVSYTIDATNAKITQGANTILVSNVVVGDTIIAQGTVNGSAVVASTIIDQVKPASTTNPHPGFFGGIGSFFARLFGF